MAKPEYVVSSITKREEKVCFFNGEEVSIDVIENIPRNSKVATTSGDKEFISFNFDLSKDLDKEAMDDSVEIKMFQEAGLNPMLDYKIAYNSVDSEVDASKVNVQAFAITTGSVEKNCKTLIDKFGYVDLYLPTTTLPTVLYNTNILEKENDLFLYFVRDNLYLSVFKNGNLVYGKTLDTGLKRLVDDFIRTTGEHIKYEELITKLVNQGVVEENYPLEDKRFAIDFRDLLTSITANLNSVLQYAMRLFAIESFNRVFVGTKEGIIPGADKLFEELLGIEGHHYLFYTDFFLEGDAYIDQRDLLLILEIHNSKNPDTDDNPYNVTTFKRPSSFMKRSGGRFFVLAGAGSLLLLMVPSFIYVQALIVDFQGKNKLSELKLNKEQFIELKKEQDRIVAEKNDLDKKVKLAQESFIEKKALLEKIHSKKVSRERVSVFINNIFKNVNSYKVKITKLEVLNGYGIFNLETKEQKNITALIKHLVANGYSVIMEEISFNSGSYKSIVKVDIK